MKRRITIVSMIAILLTTPFAAAELHADEDIFGLIAENDPSPDKTPLILIHGDNSFRYDEDRWGKFLDWISDHEDFDNRYEIWRFHHNTEEVIGYDGLSGNAAELGDAVTARFGSERQILILAHSRGGLVARSYMAGYGDGNEGDRILGLVTLATPHHGSPGAVPDWGLFTALGKNQEEELASYLYGFTLDYVVNVSDMGTMGLAWDNFDGPEHGIPYRQFSIDSELGVHHVLSVMDANLEAPEPAPGQSDDTLYLPARSFGTLEEMNRDTRHFGSIIAYGGYDTDLGAAGITGINWLNLSFSDHAGLEISTQLIADMESNGQTEAGERHYMANDGMVPLQSALFLKKDTENEPMYTVEEDENWLSVESNNVHLKDFRSRMNFRKAVICPDFDHLHMVEGNLDRYDYWEHVAGSLAELSALSETDRREFTPAVDTFEDSMPELSEILDTGSSGCFIRDSESSRTE